MLKTQKRCKSKRHNVFTEEVNKLIWPVWPNS